MRALASLSAGKADEEGESSVIAMAVQVGGIGGGANNIGTSLRFRNASAAFPATLALAPNVHRLRWKSGTSVKRMNI